MNSTSTYRSEIAVTQLIFFLVIWLMFSALNGLILPYITELFGISDMKEFIATLSDNATAENRFKLKSISAITHVFTFTVPSLLFVFLIFKTKALQFLDLHRFPHVNEINMAMLMILVAFPIAQLFLQLNHLIPLPANALHLEEQAQVLTNTILVMDTPMELIATLLIMALLPAIGEELMFRGVIQKYLTKRNVHQGIFITAFLFSALHMQFAGFLPRFFLGLVLGYLFYWSGSLWLPIIGHFVNNGFQVLAVYFYTQQGNEIKVEDAPSLPWFSYFIAIVLFCGIVYWFLRNGSAIKPLSDRTMNS